MRNQDSKNDIAWDKLFNKYNIPSRIAQDGTFTISADQIREFREPRLMAKIDHRPSLPRVFRENKLSILPVSRGEYIISHFDCFMPMPTTDTNEITRLKFPEYIQSINPYNITSETVAINCALVSGLFEDFLNDGPLAATVCGRMGSGTFDFLIANCKSNSDLKVKVNNAQIEIDTALEGISSLSLIEAKCDLSDDFIIRQLFYPYKTWENRLPKKIRLVYFVYSNGIFRLFEYAPRDTTRYDTLVLIRSRCYTFDDTDLDISDVERLLKTIRIIPDPEVPFPQADSFARIVNLCELLQSDSRTRDSVTENYDFDVRQTNYYTDAGRYLGLIEKGKSKADVFYRLTPKAVDILKLRYRERQLAFCRCILEHRVFNEVFREWLANGHKPKQERIIAIMKKASLYHIGKESTFKRRASTITSWLNWMIGLWT